MLNGGTCTIWNWLEYVKVSAHTLEHLQPINHTRNIHLRANTHSPTHHIPSKHANSDQQIDQIDKVHATMFGSNNCASTHIFDIHSDRFDRFVSTEIIKWEQISSAPSWTVDKWFHNRRFGKRTEWKWTEIDKQSQRIGIFQKQKWRVAKCISTVSVRHAASPPPLIWSCTIFILFLIDPQSRLEWRRQVKHSRAGQIHKSTNLRSHRTSNTEQSNIILNYRHGTAKRSRHLGRILFVFFEKPWLRRRIHQACWSPTAHGSRSQEQRANFER